MAGYGRSVRNCGESLCLLALIPASLIEELACRIVPEGRRLGGAGASFRSLLTSIDMVGARGFEPRTCSTQNCRATRLRYTPISPVDTRSDRLQQGSAAAPNAT